MDLNFGRSSLMALILIISFGLSIVIILPSMSAAQQDKKTFVTHTGGVISTTGEIIDPYVLVTLYDIKEFGDKGYTEGSNEILTGFQLWKGFSIA